LTPARVDRAVVSRYGRPLRISVEVAGQIIGQHRTQKRGVDESAPEFLGDNGHFDAGGAVRAQRPPTRRLNLLVQPGNSTLVIEILNRSWSEVVGQFGGGIA